MLEYILPHIRHHLKAGPPPLQKKNIDQISIRDDILKNICLLNIQSRRGLWEILLFIIISIFALALLDYNPIQRIPELLVDIFGSSPSPILVHIVLIVSTLSELIVIISRIHFCSKPKKIWSHAIFRSSFYILYFLTGSLSENFVLVLISGLVILGLEQLNLRLYCSMTIEKEKNIFRIMSLWPMSVNA
jgi:hypothetical protein